MINKLHDIKNYQDYLNTSLEEGINIFVFTANWDQIGRKFLERIEKLDLNLNKVCIVNMEDNKDIFIKKEYKKVPVIEVFYNGECKKALEGINFSLEKQIEEIIS